MYEQLIMLAIQLGGAVGMRILDAIDHHDTPEEERAKVTAAKGRLSDSMAHNAERVARAESEVNGGTD